MPYKDPNKKKENAKKYRQSHAELKEKNKKWNEENKEYLKKYQKEYRGKYRVGDPEYSKYLRSLMLIRNYGITQEEYEEILKKQNGVCAICENPPTIDKNGRTISLAVDHHHKLKGKESIRGLLCWTCNRRLISNLGDRENAVELFTKAAEYLKKFLDKTKIN